MEKCWNALVLRAFVISLLQTARISADEGTLSLSFSTRKISMVNDCACVLIYQCINGTFDKHGINQIVYKFDIPNNKQNNLLPNSCPENYVWCCNEPPKLAGSYTCIPSEPTERPLQRDLTTSSPQVTSPDDQAASNPSERSKCGYSKKPMQSIFQYRIVGRNNEARPYEFPWSVMIMTKEGIDYNMVHFQCGGSLIHERVVLTVAHCAMRIGQQTVIVRAGLQNSQEKQEDHLQERSVTKIIIHRSYDADSLYNDIALMVTDKNFVLSPNVNILCLPIEEDIVAAADCIVAGWGNTKDGNNQRVLRKTTLPIVPRDSCQSKLQETEELGADFVLHESFMCAGGIEGKDACKGDGGSPLICPVKGDIDRYQQVGIVAWGIRCGEALPGVYVNVAGFRSWIDGQMKTLGFTSYY